MDLFDLAAGDAKAHQLKAINDSQGVNSGAAMHVATSYWVHISPVHTREVPQTGHSCTWFQRLGNPRTDPVYLITCAWFKLSC